MTIRLISRPEHLQNILNASPAQKVAGELFDIMNQFEVKKFDTHYSIRKADEGIPTNPLQGDFPLMIMLKNNLRFIRNGKIVVGSSQLKEKLDNFIVELNKAMKDHRDNCNRTKSPDTHDRIIDAANWIGRIEDAILQAEATGIFIDGNPIGATQQRLHHR